MKISTIITEFISLIYGTTNFERLGLNLCTVLQPINNPAGSYTLINSNTWVIYVRYHYKWKNIFPKAGIKSVIPDF